MAQIKEGPVPIVKKPAPTPAPAPTKGDTWWNDKPTPAWLPNSNPYPSYGEGGAPVFHAQAPVRQGGPATPGPQIPLGDENHIMDPRVIPSWFPQPYPVGATPRSAGPAAGIPPGSHGLADVWNYIHDQVSRPPAYGGDYNNANSLAPEPTPISYDPMVGFDPLAIFKNSQTHPYPTQYLMTDPAPLPTPPSTGFGNGGRGFHHGGGGYGGYGYGGGGGSTPAWLPDMGLFSWNYHG